MDRQTRTFSRLFRTLAAFALAVILAAGLSFPPFRTQTHAAGLFNVNTGAESSWGDTTLSLREAINVANGTYTGPFSPTEQGLLGGCVFNAGFITGGCGAGVFDTIHFTPAASQITPTSNLPTILDAGTWIDGGAGVPVINASNLTGNTLILAANDITISNLTLINGAPGLSDIVVQSGKNIAIANNFIGVRKTTTGCSDGSFTRTTYAGVIVNPNGAGSTGANNNVAYIYGNTIGCHNFYGVQVLGADYVTIGLQRDTATLDGNYIGTDVQAHNLANGSDGIIYTVSGVDAPRFGQIYANQIKNNGGNGVFIFGTGANTTASAFSNVIRGNTIANNGYYGVYLQNGAYNTWIGGLVLSHVNLVSANGGGGIMVEGSNAVVIQGSVVTGNGVSGVYPGVNLQTANNTTIFANNIGGNSGAGILINNSDHNVVTFNSVGTTWDLSAAAPNKLDGIGLSSGSDGNIIGGDTVNDRNYISGNSGCGVRIRNNAQANTVAANYIGLDGSGTYAIPNGQGGVCIQNNSNGNGIGKFGNVEDQFIAGNQGPGVLIADSTGNGVWLHNQIGVAGDGITPLGNKGDGVELTNVLSTTIAAGVIANNGGAGVSLVGAASQAVIYPEIVKDNGGLAIDLGDDGFTPNDPGDTDNGPNTLLNYPVFTSYDLMLNKLTGTACPNCKIFFYETSNNPRFPGGSAREITPIFAIADAMGNWSILLNSPHSLYNLSAIATDAAQTISSELTPVPVFSLPLILNP